MKKTPFILFAVIAFFYIIFSYLAVKGNFQKTGTAYYNYAILMLKRGRWDLNSPITYDLSLYKNKWYMYWGPAPILFILPFYLFGKLNISDVFYTLAGGILNPLIFYLTINELIKYFRLKLSAIKIILLISMFAFVSPNLVLSLAGSIWATEQIVAIFYLLAAFFLYFRYLNEKKISRLIASYVLFMLAVFSRYTLIVQGIIYFFPLWLMLKNNSWRLLVKTTILLAAVTLAFAVMIGGYNYARFGNPLEVGMRYQRGVKRYDAYLKQNKLLSLDFVPHNVDIYFFHHLIPRLQPPYVPYDKEGNSMISVYPTLILLIALFRKKTWTKKSRFFLASSLAAIIIGTIILLLNIGTGWVQFGLRYLFDVIPLAYILITVVSGSVPSLAILLLTVYGMMINVIGTLAYYQVIK